MRTRSFAFAVSLLCVCFATATMAQQQEDKSKRPSPPGQAQVTLKGQTITIDYSRPFMRGRKIMGGLVPYGKVWRTGANEATTLTTPVDLNIGGTKVPAGKYTLWTLPSAGTWKLIINKQTGQWGTDYDPKQDLARVDMQKTSLSAPVQEFTMSFNKKSDDSADLVMQWETTNVSIPIKAE
ncbi:MAG TPA: DUF2911 domain-containing protein [Candidatus Angelobacter sp.]|nr:DUF2911 domain-containing protein [Candidatus Angelobacter sp.]